MTGLIILAAVGAGIIGGVFFAFSTFVMRALAGLPTPQAIAAMQRINVVVISPAFLGTFLGTAPLFGAAAFLAWRSGDTTAAGWLLLGFVLYAVGTVGVTIACNVPRNHRLAPLAPDGAEAAAYFPVYVREWLVWNHVRCAAALAALATTLLAMR
jgi:uncharacterized membrane protein